MRKPLLAAALLGLASAVLAFGVPVRAGEDHTHAAPKATKAFEPLQTLAGEWTSPKTAKQPYSVRYELVAGGSVLMEVINEGTPGSMISMYHPDGDKILMTHYCAVGNQPRMRGTGDAKSMTFSLVDVSNLADPKAGHMEGLTMTFTDPDHMVHEWRWRAGDKVDIHRFEFERKKPS